ncbi:MAG: disulfide bond formation protein B [Alphaproteobacteria bacterium]
MPSSFYHPKNASLLLVLAALAVLATVFALQYLAGLEPCKMCIWQRWPFAILAVLGLIGAFAWPRAMLALGLLTLLVSIGLGGYHVAVEQGWLALPAGCAAGADASSVEELKALLKAAPPTCDQVGFSVLGLSLAGWNVVSSTILALFTTIVLFSSRHQASALAHQT